MTARVRQLVVALQDRVNRARQGDAFAVLSPEAQSMADEIIAAGENYPAVIATLGHFYLATADALPGAEAHPLYDGLYRTAVHAFSQVIRADPGEVPVALRAAAEREASVAEQTNLCIELRDRFLQVGRVEDVTRAVEAGEFAVKLGGDDHPLRAALLYNLVLALNSRFERLGVVADADRAIALAREALKLTPNRADPDHALYLDTLGVALGQRFGRLGVVADVVEAVKVGRAAVALSAPGDSDRGLRFSHLANSLMASFRVTGDPVVLDEAIALAEQVVTLTPATGPRGPLALHAWGQALLAKARHSASRDDAAEAVRAASMAAKLAEADPEHAFYLNGLVSALMLLFALTGDREHVEAAIETGERAVTKAPADGPDRVECLINVGNAYAARGERFGMLADLNLAIDRARDAVAAVPPDHPLRAVTLTNLGNHLVVLFRRTGERSYLDEAIDRTREATTLLAPGTPRHGVVWSNLAFLLRTRYARVSGSREDINAAVAAGEQALDGFPETDPRRPIIQSALAIHLLNRFELVGDAADLDRARRLADVTVAPEHPDRGVVLFNLATVLGRVAQDDPVARGPAIIALDETVRNATATPYIRTEAGKLLASLVSVTGDHRHARQAWSDVFGQLPLLLDQTLDQVDRQEHLRLLGGIGPGAAATELALGGVESAWQRLEQGRGLLLGQELESRTDLERLQAIDTHLAAQVEQVRQALHTEPKQGELTGTLPDRIAVRRRALETWRSLQAAIRERGVEGFGEPPSIAELRAHLAAGETVVAINVAATRADALVLTRDRVESVPLPALRVEEALIAARGFRALVRSSRPGAQELVGGTLRWLWDAVTSPVLAHLGVTAPLAGDATDPRIWWIPTGPLSALPIHAAGHHGSGTDTVLDRVVSSYAPTLRVLAHARRRPAALPALPVEQSFALAVGVTEAFGATRLAQAAPEARHVGALLGATVLVDKEATLAAVRRILPEARWAHFACHAFADERDPAASVLRLADGGLPAREVMRLVSTDGHLAFLSACSTAYGGESLQDEAIHLASAFQVAGFSHVIASQWPIGDDDAFKCSQQIYDLVLGGIAPAVAVHRAVRSARSTYLGEPGRWAAHIHLGP